MATELSPYKVFAGSKGEALAQRICDQLGCKLGDVHIDRFSDGEFAAYFNESVRGHSVYLVQSTCPSSDNLMELILMIDAAKRASAYKVIGPQGQTPCLYRCQISCQYDSGCGCRPCYHR